MGKKVLVVSDVPDSSQLLQEILPLEGYEPTPCPYLSEAVGVAKQLLPDVALVDTRAPYRDGWTVVENLKADPVTADVPVIVFTTVLTAADRDKLRALGCLLLGKPFELDDLFTLLRQATESG